MLGQTFLLFRTEHYDSASEFLVPQNWVPNCTQFRGSYFNTSLSWELNRCERILIKSGTTPSNQRNIHGSPFTKHPTISLSTLYRVAHESPDTGCPGVDSASNRNEYQEYFLAGKGGRCVGLITWPPSRADCLEIWEPQTPGTPKGLSRPVMGLLFYLYLYLIHTCRVPIRPLPNVFTARSLATCCCCPWWLLAVRAIYFVLSCREFSTIKFATMMLIFVTEGWLKSWDVEWIQKGHKVYTLYFLVFGKLRTCLIAAVSVARGLPGTVSPSRSSLIATPNVPVSIPDRKHVITIQDIRYLPTCIKRLNLYFVTRHWLAYISSY
jgi:hypothetical protein